MIWKVQTANSKQQDVRVNLWTHAGASYTNRSFWRIPKPPTKLAISVQYAWFHILTDRRKYLIKSHLARFHFVVVFICLRLFCFYIISVWTETQGLQKRERKRQKKKETGRQRKRRRERKRKRHIDREREGERERDRPTEKETEREKKRHTDREREGGREREKEKERERRVPGSWWWCTTRSAAGSIAVASASRSSRDGKLGPYKPPLAETDVLPELDDLLSANSCSCLLLMLLRKRVWTKDCTLFPCLVTFIDAVSLWEN